jgi:hypothetical protein
VGASLGLLLGLAAAPVQAQAQPGSGRVYDRVVAVVRPRAERGNARRDEVITLSDLELEAAVGLIQWKNATGAATRALDAETLKAALERAIAERLHTQEAEKLNAFRVEPSELDAAERDFEARLPGPGELDRFLARFDADRERLRAVLEQSLRAAKAIDARIRLRAEVSEAEVRRYFTEHAREYPGTYEDHRAALKAKLFNERYRKMAARVTRELREAADVRIIWHIGEEP